MIGLSSFLPGLYEPEQVEYMQVTQDTAAHGDVIQYLEPALIAELIVQELLND